jgi:CDP-diacylglycerol--serine O-phosphatidyltransferase
MAIHFSYQNEINIAALFVLFAMIADGLDGRIARWLEVDGEFGKELDSLADIVTFGVAPAIMTFQGELHLLGNYGLAICLIFPIFGALRLAKFNTEMYKNKTHFIGLPITAAGGILALFAKYNNYFSETIYIFLVIGLSYIMVSDIKIPNFKNLKIPKSSKFVIPLMLVVIILIAKYSPGHFPMLLLIPVVLFTFIVLFKIKRKVAKKKENPEEKTES